MRAAAMPNEIEIERRVPGVDVINGTGGPDEELEGREDVLRMCWMEQLRLRGGRSGC